MEWATLQQKSDLDTLVETSHDQTVILFKHSTRCSISSSALSRVERKWDAEEMQGVKPYFLDIIAHRDISQAIEERFGVQHESPQLLVIKDGKCIDDASHMEITYELIKSFVRA